MKIFTNQQYTELVVLMAVRNAITVHLGHETFVDLDLVAQLVYTHSMRLLVVRTSNGCGPDFCNGTCFRIWRSDGTIHNIGTWHTVWDRPVGHAVAFGAWALPAGSLGFGDSCM